MPRVAVSDDVIALMRAERADGDSYGKIAARHHVDSWTARKYTIDVPTPADRERAKVVAPTLGNVIRTMPLTGIGSGPPTDAPPLPDPAPEAGGPSLPDPIPLSYDPFVLDSCGWIGVLCDPHIPYHDKRTIETWAEDCRSKNAGTLLLNGDVLDCCEVSAHYREPSAPRLKDEIACGKQFFAYLRSKFPRARIVYKEGNHDFRVRSYLATRAPALFDMPGCTLPDMLGLNNYGIEYVADKRIVQVHKLNIVHGHEFRGGGGVNPARWLWLRTNATAMCGHFHRSSFHPERSLDNRLFATWSVGCACFLWPAYDPNNKWNHGYAMVNRWADGFHVDNRQLLPDGRIV